MVRIAWRMLARRPASVLATFLALWFAVAAVTTCGGMLESGLRYHGTTSRYAAAPVLVAVTDIATTEGSGEDRKVQSRPLTAPGRLPAPLLRRIAAAPGVRSAIADVAVPGSIRVAGDAVPVQLHPWSAAQLAPFRLRAGAAPAAAAQVVLDARLAARLGVRVGQRLRLALSSGIRLVAVTGIAAPAHGSVDATVFGTDAVTRALADGAGPVGGVLPERGVTTDELAGAVRHVLPHRPADPSGAYPRAFTGADRGSVESLKVASSREFVIAASSVFGGCTLLIAVLVISGTVGLSVAQRHRDIALLRALAATPRQVRRMMVRETAGLSLVAAAAGIWPGLAAARWLRDQFVDRGMAPGTFRAQVSWLPPVVAAGAALLVAVAAAWVASLRASRIRPTQALRETTVERRGLGAVRCVLGMVALAGGIVLCVVAASHPGAAASGISVATVATLVLAATMLGPALIHTAARTVGRVLYLFGVTGRLATATTEASARRLSPVFSSLVMAVALGGSLWFVQTSAAHAATEQSRAGLVAGYVVRPAEPGLTPAAVTAVRHTRGVTAATEVSSTTMFAGGTGDVDAFTAQGVTTRGPAGTLDLGVTHGSVSRLRGAAIALDTITADSLDLHVGDTFHGWFGDGDRADLRVVAIYTRGLGFAQMTVAHELLAPHTSGYADALLVATRPGDAEAATRVRARLTHAAPGSALVTRETYRNGLADNVKQNAWTNQVVTAVLLVYVVIAAVNSLVVYALGRRRELAILRMSGTTRRQVLRMVRLEQVLLLGLALVTGVAIAAATLLPMVHGITGSATPYIPAAGWVAVLGGVVVLGGVATNWPIRAVLRSRPVEAAGVPE